MIIPLLLANLIGAAQINDQECEFTSKIVNSKTITEFANTTCWICNGSIRLDETSDVTHAQLAEAFINIERLIGTVEVVNTKFTNLSFFAALGYVALGEKAGKFTEYDLRIENNTKLESMYGALIEYPINVRIVDNPLLDVNCTHTVNYYYGVRKIRGNRKNCGCELDGPLTQTYANTLEDDCAAIYGSLILNADDHPSEDVLFRKFRSASEISGEVSIVDTNLTDLKFLRSVSAIRTFSGGNAEIFIRIENNSKLQQLGWSSITDIMPAFTIQISANPNLCFTTKELAVILSSFNVEKVQGSICKEEATDGVCHMGNDSTLSSIPGDCQTLVGRLTLDHSSSSSDLWKLYNVTSIFGQLVVRNSSLRTMSPLWMLSLLANIKPNESALIVESNSAMRSFYWYNVALYSDQPVLLRENSAMKISDKLCSMINKTAKIVSSGNRQNCPGMIDFSVGDLSRIERELASSVLELLSRSTYRYHTSYILTSEQG
ncbi:hypothetical protein Q1695_016398 [Nippostrongylus brasiliensis]|nr:hypothetical protein Q1695_016398 [Nippostrongylus brasiliensis]